MTFLLMLVDKDDNVALVSCPTREVLEGVGAAAIYGTGGVSAYPVLEHAILSHDKVKEILNDGGNANAQLPSTPIIRLLTEGYST